MKSGVFSSTRREKIKRIAIISVVICIVVALITLSMIYFFNQNFRKWVDVSILRKNITTKDIVTMDLDSNKNNQIYCYGKNICILNEKNLKIYNQEGLNIADISTNINTAVFNSYEKYLAIAEASGQEFYVIYDKEMLFNEKIERRNN